MPSTNLWSEKEMSDTEAAYVAAFIDGEGSIMCFKEKREENRSGFAYVPHMAAANTHLGVLEAVRDMTGNGRIHKQNRKKAKESHKDIWRLSWTPDQMRHILPQLLPHLIIKHEQAALALKLLDLKLPGNNYGKNNAEEQHQIWSAMRKLNHRGIDSESLEYGGVRDRKRNPVPTCSLPGCKEKHYGKGLCRKHYRWKFESASYSALGDSVFDRDCLVCGKSLEDLPVQAKFCSHSCKMKDYRKRKKQS